MRALVVDSSESSRHTLQELLHACGVETLEANVPDAGLDALQSEPRPDVVFCEPGPTGSRQRKLLQTLTGNHDLPVILIESDADTDFSSDVMPDVAVSLTRPFDRESIVTALNAVGLQLPQSQAAQSPVESTVSHADGLESDTVILETSRARTHAGGRADVRVLVVDPESLMRRLLGKVITETPGFALAATAQDGTAALEKIARLEPDVVTLDLDVPIASGLETLKQIHATWPDLPVIVFSALAHGDSEITMKCLVSGANDYLAKPESMPDVETAEKWLRQHLLPCVRQFFPDMAPLETGPPEDRRNSFSTSDTIEFVMDPSDTQILHLPPKDA